MNKEEKYGFFELFGYGSCIVVPCGSLLKIAEVDLSLSNIWFIAFAMGIYNFSGIFGAQRTSNEFDLAIAISVGALVALYLGQAGQVTNLWGELVPISSLWGYFALFVICTASAGAFAAASIGFALLIKDALEPAKVAYENQDQADFAADFDAKDERDFAYDPKTFDDDKPAPRGFEKRHPDDAKLWAMVDDPEATSNERAMALDKIMKRESSRNSKGANSFAPAE